MNIKPQKRKTWTMAQDEELLRRHKNQRLTDISREMGFCYTTILRHARKLGISFPVTGGYNAQAREVVKDNFHTHSYRELARIAGVDNRTVWVIIKELGLKKTDEQMHSVISRIHKDIYASERMRVNWGMEQKTRLKVFSNKKKILLRCRLVRKGYIKADDGFTLYYTEDTKRSIVCEEHGIAMGLRFGPLPAVNHEETEYDSASQGMRDVQPDELSLA